METTGNVDPIYRCYVECYIHCKYGNFLMCPFHLDYSIRQLWVHVQFECHTISCILQLSTCNGCFTTMSCIHNIKSCMYSNHDIYRVSGWKVSKIKNCITESIYYTHLWVTPLQREAIRVFVWVYNFLNKFQCGLPWRHDRYPDNIWLHVTPHEKNQWC
jgi:hypothetical protein